MKNKFEDRLVNVNDVIEAVDKHTREDGTLDEDISVILEEVETAFDKEKVIDELKSAENYLYVNGIRITNFKFIHTLTAIEIVEKGGIE